MTDLANGKCAVTDGSMLFSLPSFCLVHTVILVQMKCDLAVIK